MGRGIIISDEDEVTGVISVKANKDINNGRNYQTLPNPAKSKSMREKLTDTLNRKGKGKKKKNEPKKPPPSPPFVFANKPHFSSESDVSNISDLADLGKIKKHHSSQLALRSNNR